MRVATIISVVCLAIASACINREVAEITPDQSKEQFHNIPIELNRDVDILFVIDDSGSMEAEQTSLALNFHKFINVLETIEGGLPNVHIGVISTDLGTGPFNNCSAGKNGRLQTAPRPGCTVSPPAGSFISNVKLADGERQTNYPEAQTLADTFSCIARLGTEGCGFEQPLEAMRLALNGSNPNNLGFLRDDAYLAVIFITDEDDCSTENTQMFDPSQNSADEPLGFLAGFRCFEFGVACEPDDPRQLGVKENCIPRPDSPYMFDPGEYIQFLQDLKGGDDLLILAGIIGVPSPVRVELNGAGQPAVKKSCGESPTDGNSGAVPALRVESVLDAFPQQSTKTSICDPDLSGALDVIAQLLKKKLGTPCLIGAVADADPDQSGLQPTCEVSLVRYPGSDREQETKIPSCDNAGDPSASTNQPCYLFQPEPELCGDQPTGLAIRVFPEEQPSSTHLFVRCLVD
jgi:hypothetical protein